MSKILKGITESRNFRYPEDPDEYRNMYGSKSKSSRPDDDFNFNFNDSSEDNREGIYKLSPSSSEIEYKNIEGTAPNGQRYNSSFIISTSSPQIADSEIRKFQDRHWGAKKIVDVVKKEPNVTIVYYVDQHKHGFRKPWKDSEPATESNIQKFKKVLEGISQEDLANVLCHRIEMRYPDIYKKYGYDKIYDAVDDVASFHAGAEELGSSDINIMIRQVFNRLEESEGVEKGK